MKTYQLPYHLVELRPWPLTSAIRATFMALGLINWLHFNDTILLLLGTTTMLLSLFQWCRDIIREATYMGKHTSHVQKGLKLGILLFITSEICFFSAFFWAFFHRMSRVQLPASLLLIVVDIRPSFCVTWLSELHGYAPLQNGMEELTAVLYEAYFCLLMALCKLCYCVVGFDSCYHVVATRMGDCLRTGKPSRYVTNHQGQLSLPSLRGR